MEKSVFEIGENGHILRVSSSRILSGHGGASTIASFSRIRNSARRHLSHSYVGHLVDKFRKVKKSIKIEKIKFVVFEEIQR